MESEARGFFIAVYVVRKDEGRARQRVERAMKGRKNLPKIKRKMFLKKEWMARGWTLMFIRIRRPPAARLDKGTPARARQEIITELRLCAFWRYEPSRVCLKRDSFSISSGYLCA